MCIEIQINYCCINFLCKGEIIKGEPAGVYTPRIEDSFVLNKLTKINSYGNNRNINDKPDVKIDTIRFKDIYSEIQTHINENYNKYI